MTTPVKSAEKKEQPYPPLTRRNEPRDALVDALVSALVDVDVGVDVLVDAAQATANDKEYIPVSQYELRSTRGERGSRGVGSSTRGSSIHLSATYFGPDSHSAIISVSACPGFGCLHIYGFEERGCTMLGALEVK